MNGISVLKGRDMKEKISLSLPREAQGKTGSLYKKESPEHTGSQTSSLQNCERSMSIV